MQLLPDNRHFNTFILSKVWFPYNRKYLVFSQDLIFLSGVLSDANFDPKFLKNDDFWWTATNFQNPWIPCKQGVTELYETRQNQRHNNKRWVLIFLWRICERYEPCKMVKINALQVYDQFSVLFSYYFIEYPSFCLYK